MEFKSNEFCIVPEKLILAFGHEFSVDLYIKLSDTKIIKLSHKDDDLREAYLRYKLKGMQEAYVRAEEYRDFLTLLRAKIAGQQTTSGIEGPPLKFEELDAIYMALKEVTLKLGINEDSVNLSKDVSIATFKAISKAGNLFQSFKVFRKDCSTEFMAALLVSFISCAMLEKFPWCSLAIKEKLVLATLLCDITLSKEDFELIKKYRRDPFVNWENILNARVYNHPINCARMMSPYRSLISTETLTIIEQHHENSSSSGFPKRLHPSSINVLSAIFIIAEEFSAHLSVVDFDYHAKDEILTFMKKKYDKGNFKKAFESLILALNEVVDEEEAA